MENIKNDEVQPIKVEDSPKEPTGEPQLPSPLVADPTAEKDPEPKAELQAIERNGGEDNGPLDGGVPEAPAEPAGNEELEDDLPDPAPILRRSSRAKAQKRRRYDEEY
ncbi:hypothetical protein CAEBREN_22591 [Caenorhabditis brenneri]|uniref:Uncharacterized protein n=1 Tax=Caenorhabditis brenneri TaxID=135651 RepID=G0P4G9_CAEBE|nr:hypothetical protein CAEBREN_22591 [Caenorhabditis brenneri]